MNGNNLFDEIFAKSNPLITTKTFMGFGEILQRSQLVCIPSIKKVSENLILGFFRRPFVYFKELSNQPAICFA